VDLHVFWFLILGLLLSGYGVLDGFDLGVGILHLWVRKDEERRALNSIGPLSDGNEVWLVVLVGALFSAFPKAYAAGSAKPRTSRAIPRSRNQSQLSCSSLRFS
jgi:cytochrome d ubiquinol oxidase subunit II